MTLRFDIRATLQARLMSKAQAAGLPLERYIENVLEREAAGPEPVADEAPPTTGCEKARAFEEWAQSHRQTPPLSDEAISRETLYGERG